METSDINLVKEGWDKRRNKRNFGACPSVSRSKCPVCKEGHLFRYSSGEWSKCDACGWGGDFLKKTLT